MSTFVPAESSPSLSVVSVTITIEEANKARVTCRYPLLNVEALDENLRHCVLPLFLFLFKEVTPLGDYVGASETALQHSSMVANLLLAAKAQFKHGAANMLRSPPVSSTSGMQERDFPQHSVVPRSSYIYRLFNMFLVTGTTPST